MEFAKALQEDKGDFRSRVRLYYTLAGFNHKD